MCESELGWVGGRMDESKTRGEKNSFGGLHGAFPTSFFFSCFFYHFFFWSSRSPIYQANESAVIHADVLYGDDVLSSLMASLKTRSAPYFLSLFFLKLKFCYCYFKRQLKRQVIIFRYY